MIIDLLLELQGIDLYKVDFQREMFADHIVSGRDDHNCSPRTSNLSLRDHKKDKVHSNSPAQIQGLKYGIHETVEGFGNAKFPKNDMVRALCGLKQCV